LNSGRELIDCRHAASGFSLFSDRWGGNCDIFGGFQKAGAERVYSGIKIKVNNYRLKVGSFGCD